MKIKKLEQVILLVLAFLLSCSTPNTSGIEMEGDMKQEEIAETSSQDCENICVTGACGVHNECNCGQCESGQTCSEIGVCAVDDTCNLVCEGLECGKPFDCNCGECAIGICNDEGKCEVPDEDCDTICGDRVCGTIQECLCGTCAEEEVCLDDGTCLCIPDCMDKDCGTDGCGSECGMCTETEECIDNKCICGTCGEDEVCLDDGTCLCIPDCKDKECGTDGCGSDCGMCTDTEECIDNKCVCTASCDDIECGTNACGEACGTCLVGQSCVDGKCKEGDCPGGCDDNHPCTVDTCHPELGCTFQWIEPCCGNFILEEGEDCDDGNTKNDDGCSDECIKDPYVQYVGVTEWTQNCGVHDDAKQDELMHETCQEEYGDSARAATGIEVVNDWIIGLGPIWWGEILCIVACPGCEGETSYHCVEAHARNCAFPGALFPSNVDDFFKKCSTTSPTIRNIICVQEL